jgi:hypothetical protein
MPTGSTWIINEDNALREHLGGITVHDEAQANRPVPVYFRFPDAEVTKLVYPFLTIDLVGLYFEAARARSGPYVHEFPYLPPGLTADDLTDDPKKAWKTLQLAPQPYSFEYQVTAWSRNPLHDSQLLATLLTYKIPYQYGAVRSRADKTTRRLDLMSLNRSNYLDAGKKRTFRNMFRVRMSSELFIEQLNQIATVWSEAIIQGPDNGAFTPINVTVPAV